MLTPLVLATVVLSLCPNGFRKYMEWRDMSLEQQFQYTVAMKCFKEPPKSKLGVGKPRLHVYVEAYSKAFPFRPDNLYSPPSTFLPFQRAFMRILDHELTVGVCKYTGPIPYWDWTRDNDSPWKKEHNPEITAKLEKTGITPNGEYDTFRKGMQSFDVEAQKSMSFTEFSPPDFLLLLHFRNIDRLWAMWQRRSPANSFAYAAPKDLLPVSINGELHLYGLYRNAVVREVMDITDGGLDGLMCYNYVPPQKPVVQM